MFRLGLTRLRQNLFFVVGILLGLILSWMISSLTLDRCIYKQNVDYYVDDYEPKINLAQKPIQPKKDAKPFTRPRYYSQELGTRDKLFVGVLSTYNTIRTRGVAVNKTVCHLVDKLMFFISAPGPQRLNLSMPGIVGFTDSRRNLKPFHVIKYIGDNYLDDYDYYFLSTDYTYINARELNNLVRNISVSQHIHAGGAIEGKQSAICSIDSGVLLSNSVFRQVHSKLDWCIKNSITENDNINLGRCILHTTDLPCRTTAQGLEIRSLRLKPSWNLPKKNETYHSVFPAREVRLFYKFHFHFMKRRLEQIDNQIDTLKSAVINMSYLAPGGRDALVWPIGANPGSRPKTRFDVLRWDYFTMTHMYPESEFSNLKRLSRAESEDIQFVLNSTLDWVKTRYDNGFDFLKLENGYRRFDPTRGLDYRLDLKFKDKLTGEETIKRLEVCKPLGRTEVVPFPYVTENTRVNVMLLVRSSDRQSVLQFLQQYSSVLMARQDKTFLLLVLIYDPTVPGKGNKDDVFLDIKKSSVSLTNKHKKSGSKIAWVSVKLPQQQNHWSHSLLDFGAVDLAVQKLPSDGLVFICLPNAELRQEFFNRIRMNTVRGMQIFSPIPFQEYNPDIIYNKDFPRPDKLDVNKNYGRYDTSNKEMISFYVTDYIAARDKIKDKLPVVATDKDITKISFPASESSSNSSDLITNLALNKLYSLFIRASEVHVLRAVEPSLRLRYPHVNCKETMSYYCSEDGLLLNMGSRKALGKYYREHVAKDP